MSTLALIPARGGSKRIPRKNIRDFRGQPIIAYAIETALRSQVFDEVMVSTDDEEIAQIALQHGATVPFMRSTANSDDHATTSEVICEVLQKYLESGVAFDYCCCIYPTAALVTVDLLIQGHALLIKEDLQTVVPVVAYSYPIDRALVRDNRGLVTFRNQENKAVRTQDLSDMYHDAGQFYWIQNDRFLEDKEIWTPQTGSIILSPLQVQDIDSETDWKLAELKYALIHG